MFSDIFDDYLVNASLAERREELAQLHRSHEAQPPQPEREPQHQRRRRLADHPLVTALLRWLTGPTPPYFPEL